MELPPRYSYLEHLIDEVSENLFSAIRQWVEYPQPDGRCNDIAVGNIREWIIDPLEHYLEDALKKASWVIDPLYKHRAEGDPKGRWVETGKEWGDTKTGRYKKRHELPRQWEYSTTLAAHQIILEAEKIIDCYEDHFPQEIPFKPPKPPCEKEDPDFDDLIPKPDGQFVSLPVDSGRWYDEPIFLQPGGEDPMPWRLSLWVEITQPHLDRMVKHWKEFKDLIKDDIISEDARPRQKKSKELEERRQLENQELQTRNQEIGNMADKILGTCKMGTKTILKQTMTLNYIMDKLLERPDIGLKKRQLRTVLEEHFGISKKK